MKKRNVERELSRLGWRLKREGSNHEIWTNSEHSEALPRHREINDILTKKIIQIAKSNPPRKK